MLETGKQFGRYEIRSQIGAGGMGEVYLAQDSALNRKVAIKLLNDGLCENQELLRRFRQEARSASALNHPNIVTIYEIGECEQAQCFIAMEFVEGSNLRHLLEKRKIKLKETLDVAIQTASALAAAHAVGIVHRDIKPENIMRRPDGLVKILDFGLAKQLFSPIQSSEIDSDAITEAKISTMPGTVMGTVQYMSPEQIRGKPVDARTDIWSLGVVLYEMITGRPPFEGETKTDVMAAILQTDSRPLSVYKPNVPLELEHIVRKALGKDCEQRYQVVKDLLLDLKLFQSELDSSIEISKSGSFLVASAKHTESELHLKHKNSANNGQRLWLTTSALVFLLAAFFGYYSWRQYQSAKTNYSASLDSSQITSWKSDLGEGDRSRARLSPDGKLVAFVASKDGSNAIWLKQIDGGEPFTYKQDDSTKKSPIFSSDGGRIAYISERGERRGIWTSPALGGAPTLLAPLNARSRLVYWSKDGATVYFDMKQNLYALDVAAKQMTKLTNFEESQAVERGFSFSPDEQQIVYADRENGQKDLWIADKHGENVVRLTDDAAEDSSPVWHPDGQRIIYSSDRNGIRQIYTAYLDGRPPIQLTSGDSGSDMSDISADGTKILYQTTKDDSDLWGVRLNGGKEFQLTSDIGAEFWLDAAPDGETVAYQAVRRTSIGSKLFNCLLLSQKANSDSRQVQLAPDGFSPRWSPDGNQLAFLRSEAGNSLWVTSATGGDARVLTDGGVTFGGFSQLPFNRYQTQDYQWSSDNRSLIYCANRSGISNVWQAAADGTGEKQLTNNEILYQTTKDDSDLWGVRLNGGKEFQLTSDIGAEFWLDAAPDGETVAYQAVRRTSIGSKLFNCLLLSQKANSDSRQVQLAPDGFSPRWSPDGNQLAFLRSEAGNSLWVTSATGGDARVLTDGGVTFGGFSQLPFNRYQTQDYQWSSDNRSLIYCANRSGISNVWQAAADGTGEKQLTNNEDKSLLLYNPLSSSDGGRIAWLTRSIDNQKKISLSIWIFENGNARQIYQSNFALGLVGWSPSGNELIIKSVESNSDIQILPVEVNLLQLAFDGSQPQLISKLKETYFQNIQLSPDHKTLAFVTRQNGESTIQIVPSTGGAAKTVISSNDARVYFSSLDFAPDSKTLYYGKQANWQIISMIENFK